jgi:hypothetical protein
MGNIRDEPIRDPAMQAINRLMVRRDELAVELGQYKQRLYNEERISADRLLEIQRLNSVIQDAVNIINLKRYPPRPQWVKELGETLQGELDDRY